MNTPFFINTTKKLLLLFGIFCITSTAGLTQESSRNRNPKGKIAGKVVDAQTGMTIIGANILLEGTHRGDATDINGEYAIGRLAPGIYTISISYISYAQKTITGIEVKPGEVTAINVTLQAKTQSLGEITVTAEIASNSAAGLLALQRESVAFQDGLSAEYLGKTGDSNVASALKRVPGVSIVGDNQVFVRGLGNRYSSVQLNGAQVPSTSPTKNEVPLDLVGSGLIDHVVVQKTYTPDLSGEFAGGSVQITTREFPHEQNFGFSYSTGINTLSGFNSTLGYSGSSTDFLGFDSGKRNLPSILKSQRLTSQNRAQAARAFHNSWAVTESRKAIPSQKISINYANQFNEDQLPIGLVSSFTYKYDRDLEPNKILRTIRSYNDSQDAFLLRSDYQSDVGVETAKLGGMLNLFVKPSSVTKIGLKTLYSNTVENSTHVIVGDYFNYPRTTRQTILDFDRRSIFSSALELETYFREWYNSSLSFNLNYSRALRKRPDRRTTQYNLSDEGQYRIYFDDGGNNHYFAHQQDNIYSTKVDYELDPLNFLKVKVGISGLLKDRDFGARRFEYRNFSKNYPDDLYTAAPNEALDADLVAQDLLGFRETSGPRDSYTGRQELWAAYISTIWHPLEKLSFEVGARMEASDMEVSIMQNGTETRIANVDNTDILPAVNITYSISDKTNLRGAFSMTLARPQFREISDFRFQDFIGGQTIYGNPDLEQTNIQNYDLRLETYPNPGELLAVSAFYKKFDKPIALFYRFTEALEVQYKNAKEAVLYGFEVEARKYLTSNLQVVANAAYIFSETQVKEEDKYAVANPERPMYGQSPYTVNLGIFYTVPSTTINLALNYHTFGKRLIRVGKRAQHFDEYEQPFHSLNVEASYTYGAATFSAGIENVLNDDIVYKQGDLTTFSYKPGMTIETGVSFSF